jgi:hypothetical protein
MCTNAQPTRTRYWDTAEETVETRADTTSSSPVPDDKRVRREKAASRGLKAAGIAPAKRPGAVPTTYTAIVVDALEGVGRALTPRR